MSDISMLNREIDTFNRELPSLTGKEGRYALVAEDRLIGTFDTYSDALAAGYEARAMAPFMVKRISAVEVVANFSRDIKAA